MTLHRKLPGFVRKHPYAVAAVVTFAVRITLILVRKTYDFPASQPFNLGFETGSIARSLATGEGFSSPFSGSTGPTSWIAPIYPLMCAVVFKVFGVYTKASAICILGLNSVFSALTCFVIGAVARRTVGERIGIVSAFVWAVLPHFAKWPTEWVWETALSALLSMVVIWLTMVIAEEWSWKRWVEFGVLWGVIVLTNPALLTLLPFSAAWLAFKRHDATFWKRATVSALLCTALVLPWMVRNRVVMGKWVFIRDNFPFEFHLGNFHGSTGMGWAGMHPTWNPAEFAKYRRLGELGYIDQAGQQAKAFVRENPGEFVHLCWVRFTGFWDGTPLGYTPRPWPWTPPTFLFCSLLAFAGLIWATWSRVQGMALFWWILVYPAPYYITYPHPRYRHAVEPEMILLAVYAVAMAIQWARRRRA